jgi:hypothetical protein
VLLDRGRHLGTGVAERDQAIGTERFDDQLANQRGVRRSTGPDRFQTLLGDRDLRVARVAGDLGDQPALLHPGQVVRHPALLPLGRLTQLERAHPPGRRLRQVDQDLEVRRRQPVLPLQMPRHVRLQQLPHQQIAAPRLLLVVAEPRFFRHVSHLTLPG